MFTWPLHEQSGRINISAVNKSIRNLIQADYKNGERKGGSTLTLNEREWIVNDPNGIINIFFRFINLRGY